MIAVDNETIIDLDQQLTLGVPIGQLSRTNFFLNITARERLHGGARREFIYAVYKIRSKDIYFLNIGIPNHWL